MRPFTCFVALNKGTQDIGVSVHTGGNISDRVAAFARRLSCTRDRQITRLALNQQVVGFLISVRSFVAVARNIANDQTWMRCSQTAGVQTHAGCGAWRQILHKHIGFGNQLLEYLQVLGVL